MPDNAKPVGHDEAARAAATLMCEYIGWGRADDEDVLAFAGVLQCYLTARDMVLVPRVLDPGIVKSLRDAFMHGRESAPP